MGVGVFGKLPARRDYVQNGVDSRLMAVLDPWLQASVSESREALGHGWLDVWLRAPIWRFWLGRRIAGVTVLGAMMPSVDGVGRYFPLCVLGACDDVPVPRTDAQPGWFEAVETLMLAALAEGGTYEALLAGLGALPPPASAHDVRRAAGDSGVAEDVSGAFAALGRNMAAGAEDDLSYWWVPPFDGASPVRALVRRGLPSPTEYAVLIAPAPEPETGGT